MGINGNVDMEKAIYRCEKAASQGNGAAMNNLGRIYAKGQGVSKDVRKTENLDKKAIDAGCMVALSLAKGEEAEFLQAEQAGLLCLIRRYGCPIYFQAFERAGQN